MSHSNIRREDGSKLMRKVFGEDAISLMEQGIGKISPEFTNFLKETFSDIYGDDTLDLKTKEIIVLSSLITQKDSALQISSHIKAALRAGITKKEILALIRHLVIYIGFPSTLNALHSAQEAFNEFDKNNGVPD